jgi:hypothetical protein
MSLPPERWRANRQKMLKSRAAQGIYPAGPEEEVVQSKDNLQVLTQWENLQVLTSCQNLKQTPRPLAPWRFG